MVGNWGNNFVAHAGSMVNVSGGLLGSFNARSDSIVKLFGGSMVDSGPYHAEEINVSRGAAVTIAGGAFVPTIFAESGASLILEGFDFRLDDQPVAGLGQIGDMLQLDVRNNQLLTGVLADGTPFISRDLNSGALTLKRFAEVAADPTTIEVPSDVAPSGIRDGQTLILNSSGSLVTNFTAASGSALRVVGGNAPGPLWAVNSAVQIEGGHVGRLTARDGTTVSQMGGEMFAPSITERSTFHLHGGIVAGRAYVDGRSEAHISGGVLSSVLIDRDGVLSIRGGAFGNGLSPNPGGLVNIDGYDFRINGQLVADIDQIGNSVVIPKNLDAVVTGTLSDGTPFAFHSLDGDRVATGTWTLRRSQMPSSIPSVISIPSDPVPLGVSDGQALNVGVNGVIGDHFNAGHGSASQSRRWCNW